ncbi:hypothetical protein QFZ36_001265 [Pseudarthrobacter siccitolerans]|uniref:LPXTG-motif cell wall anchor domain protein n=1 Tax=Pseudarthrobacter siccitolerans TaxID=861266 RepID=A0ABU0PIC3_9MICC|nr:hypothetical protein [Pseudarthrobacter siccitolerans]MDQ0673704.1 hypothetical protein [Pseudarthrobacter siccitolerans]
MKSRQPGLIVTGSVSALLLMASPAAAADELLFSADGETWGPALNQPMFEDTVLVPGDQVSRSFWVRNGSGYNADLAVGIDGEVLSPAASPASLWVIASVGESSARVPGASGEDRLILAMPAMGAAESQKITITVGLGDQAANVMQEQAIPVQFRVNMTESSLQASPTGPDGSVRHTGGEGPQPGAPLANTGLIGLWIATLGASLVAGGWLAVTRSRSQKIISEGVPNGTA